MTAATATATATASSPPQSALSSLISSYTTATTTTTTTTTAAAAAATETSIQPAQSAQAHQLALALTVLHNLQYQHSWTALSLHAITASDRLISLPQPSSPGGADSTANSTHADDEDDIINTYLISGLPPKHSYIHPTLQNHLVRREIDETRLLVQREWVLPVGTAGPGPGPGPGSGSRSGQQGGYRQPWTLQRLCTIFDALPARERVASLKSQSSNNNNNNDGDDLGGIEWQDPKRVLMGMLAANGKGGDGTIVYYIMHEGEVKPRPNG